MKYILPPKPKNRIPEAENLLFEFKLYAQRPKIASQSSEWIFTHIPISSCETTENDVKNPKNA